MEYNGHGFLEELLGLRSDPWENPIPIGINELYTNGFSSFDAVFENPISINPPNSSTQDLPLAPFDQTLNSSFTDFYYPFGDEVSKLDDSLSFPAQEELYSLSSMVEDEEHGGVAGNHGVHNLEVQQPPCKEEPTQVPIFNNGLCQERKNKSKKLDGQPSKNLMAERRRRKRLNDRLSMLRSVVPKISKMDRTSILGDTIDYMKELLERINNLQEDIHEEEGSNQLNLMTIFKDVKPNEILVRNSPKFDVERRNMDTRIEICCGGKPGLLLSTVTTLEALGLEIQQCVISCFNDFAMQASCSEEMEQRAIISSEDIKQALFRNAGYGGRCL